MYPVYMLRDGTEELKESEYLDLFASSLAAIGSIIAVLGILEETEDVEEIEGGTVAPDAPDPTGEGGFHLAFIGAVIVALGEYLGTVAIAKGISASQVIQEREDREKFETKKTIKEMQEKIKYLQRDMNSIIRLTTSLQQENLLIQRKLLDM